MTVCSVQWKYSIFSIIQWLLFNTAISWREKFNLQSDDDEVRLVPDQHANLNLYSASSLKQQTVDSYVAPLEHIILIPSQLIFALSP